eukprot:5792283-Pyramimonas_sp.AAC.1
MTVASGIVVAASRLADAVGMGAMETAAADLEHYVTMAAVPSTGARVARRAQRPPALRGAQLNSSGNCSFTAAREFFLHKQCGQYTTLGESPVPGEHQTWPSCPRMPRDRAVVGSST